MNDLQIPLAGMNSAAASLDRTAVTIANSANPSSANSNAASPGDQVDLSDSMVQMLQARNDFSANAKVVHTLDEMQQSALNILG